MAFFSSFLPQLIGVYDNELVVSYFSPGNNGKVLGRTALENVHHSGGSPENHPTLPNIIKNKSGHVFLKGSFSFEWEWPEGNVTEQELDNYINLVSTAVGSTPYTLEKSASKITMIMPDANYQIDDWSAPLAQWHPKAPLASLTATSDQSEFVCVTRLNGTYSDYTFEQRTIEAGETLEVERPESTTCYFMFSDHVVKGTTVLLSKKLYKVTSSTLQITNNQTDRVRVMRYYK
jgi:hypothetical protein